MRMEYIVSFKDGLPLLVKHRVKCTLPILELVSLYRLARWDIICRPKDQGGLGIINLKLQNKCLLAKWLVNLLNTEGMW